MFFFFLVNGNELIGLGHIKRCLILAEEAKINGITSYFFSTKNSTKANAIIANEGYELIKLQEQPSSESITNEVRSKAGFQKSLLIIDTDELLYRQFEFQNKLLKAGVLLMHIAVDNNGKFLSNYLLNQNIIARSLQYDSEEYTKKMLGLNYFIFDEQARTIQPKENLIEKDRYSLLVSFGGADPLNLTSKVLSILYRLSHRLSKVYVIVGMLNVNLSEIKTIAKKSGIDMEIIYNTTEMYDYMRSVDIALCSMGLTFWELALHNVPCISLSGSVREEKVLDYLADANYCIKLGYGNQFDEAAIGEKLEKCFLENCFLQLDLKGLLGNLNKNGAQLVIKTILENETSD